MIKGGKAGIIVDYNISCPNCGTELNFLSLTPRNHDHQSWACPQCSMEIRDEEIARNIINFREIDEKFFKRSEIYRGIIYE